MNSFTNSEWGNGDENPCIFNPQELDANQWVKSIAAAGMKGLILTCKHHDGFCLWPSQYTKHSLAYSPYLDGKADIVRDVATACQTHDIKFGIYLSPWDRNNSSYGYGTEYDDFFCAQLRELLSNYGDIFCVWFDGACGEGSNGKKQQYDWERYYSLVRQLQPMACISVCGPDIRWCGNEAGCTRPKEWSVVPKQLKDAELVAEHSQQVDSANFATKKLSSKELDLGSRQALSTHSELIWYPSEVDVSIRPGWFYHASEDKAVKSVETLLDLYERSVGANSLLLLNVPPMPTGLISPVDCEVLKQLGERIHSKFANNLFTSAKLILINFKLGENTESYLFTEDHVKDASIELQWTEERLISCVVLQEDLRFSQRTEAFYITNLEDEILYTGSVVGHKCIINLTPTYTTGLKIHFTEARISHHLSSVAIY